MRPPLLDVDLVELALQMPPELGYGGINRSLARDSVAGDVPDGVRLAAKKSDLQPFYHRSLSGADLAPIRLLLEPPDARIYRYADRAYLLELSSPSAACRPAGLAEWEAAIWASATAEIALRSLEDAEFCQQFIDAHDPPAAATTRFHGVTGLPAASSFSQSCGTATGAIFALPARRKDSGHGHDRRDPQRGWTRVRCADNRRLWRHRPDHRSQHDGEPTDVPLHGPADHLS